MHTLQAHTSGQDSYMAVKAPWLGLGGAILVLAAWTGLENITLTLQGAHCTWWLLGLAVKAPWLGPGGPILVLAAWTGLKNATLT